MIRISLMLLTAVMITGQLFSQGNYEVKRGERPPVDISKVSPDAWEAGRIKIKIKSGLYETLKERSLNAGEADFVTTGHAGMDKLNQDFAVREYKPLFASLNESHTISSQLEERHKAWGFHLWYELTLDSRADVAEAVRQYSALADIEIAEPEYKKQLVIDDPAFRNNESVNLSGDSIMILWAPNDPQYGNQWHYNNTGQQGGIPGADIKVESAWDLEKGYNGVIVAIIDGGIQINHSDLAANMWSGVGYNFVNNTPTIIAHNHGTHVAGTVAAVNSNGTGVAGVAGGSGSGDGVRLMSCQVFTASSSGGFHLAPVYAADNGASISQNSWGYTQVGVYDAAVLDAIDYFNIHGGGNAMVGGITIFAAGNSNASGQWYPGCYSGALSVAATNNQDKKAWYSNYDTWIDVSAPGGETNSVSARGVLSTLTGNTYGYYQGTSMACPHVSGVAALVASMAQRNGLSLLNTDVKNILKNTTDNHYAVNTTFIGKLGTGRVNAFNALVEVQDMFAGIINPLFLSANAYGANQINLDWQKNPQNNNVILAWSLDESFGSPVDGIVYQVGQTLPGNGTILYKGAANSFEHIDLLNSTTYYYKIWSVNALNEYSSGREAAASTDCEFYSQLPYIQDFNTSSNAPNCWAVVDNIGNGQVWNFGRGALLTGTTGNYAYLNSDAYGQGNSQNSDLISPTFDLSGYTSVTLTFKHYFRQYSSASTARLSYSIDNGLTWVTIQAWSSSIPNPSIFNQIIPEVGGQSAVKFKWNFTSTWAYYWSIDDIMLTGNSGASLPFVETLPTSDILSGSAVAGGNVISDGGSAVTERGFYWGTQSNPQVTGFKLQSGSGSGSYTQTIENLFAQTLYYVKAYATNTAGTSYGSEITFFTTPPADVILGNLVISSTLDTCMDATHTITVAGGGTVFTVNSGGSVNLVAGENIIFLDGTWIKSDGYLRAYIDTTGEYCNNPLTMLAAIEETETIDRTEKSDPAFSETPISTSNEQPFYSVYPNPTSGILKIDLPQGSESENIIIEVFGLMGERISGEIISGSQNYELNLTPHPAGVYIVRILQGQRMGVERIIKR